jgi:hypothetical protein
MLENKTNIDKSSEKIVNLNELKNKELIRETTNDAIEYIKKLIPSLKNISKQLRAGEVANANKSFTYCIEGIDWIAQLISIFKTKYGLHFQALKSSQQSASELEADLLNTLTEIMPAQIKSDWVLMADLIEHELVHNLQAWISIIPQVVSFEKE